MCLVLWRCLPLWFTAALAASVPMNTGEVDSEESRRVLGSSVVTSVSVITDHGNGTKQYYADAAGKPVTKPTGAGVGSPSNLLAPDRYEFYTFDESGDLVKSLMTLDQIQGLIAGSDNDAMDSDATAPIYFHEPLPPFETHVPAADIVPLPDLQGVHNVVASVQNVLKSQLEATKSRFPVTKPLAILSVPDEASSWSILVPGVMGSTNDSSLVLDDASSTHKPLVKVTTIATTLSPTTKIPAESTYQPSITDKVTEPPPPIIHYLPIHNIPKPPKRPQHPTITKVTPVSRPSTATYSNSSVEKTTTLPMTVPKTTIVPTTPTSKPAITSTNSLGGDAKPSTLSNSVESSTQVSVTSKIADVVPDVRPISNEMAASLSNVISQMTDEMTTKIVDANFIPVDTEKFTTHQPINRLTSVPTVTATTPSHRKPNPDRITYIPVQVLTYSHKPTKIASKPSTIKYNVTTSTIHEFTTKSSVKLTSSSFATAVKDSTTPLPIKRTTLKASNSINKVTPVITTQNPVKGNHSLESTTLPQKPNGIINHGSLPNHEAFGTHTVEIVSQDSFPSTLIPARISSVISTSEPQLTTTPSVIHSEGLYSLNAEQRTPTPQLSSANIVSIESLKPPASKPHVVSEGPLRMNTTTTIYPEKQSANKPQVKPPMVNNVQNQYTKLNTVKPQPILTNITKSPAKNYTSITQLPNKSSPNKHNNTLSVNNKNNMKFKNNVTSNGYKPTYKPSKSNGTSDLLKDNEASFAKLNNSNKSTVKPILNNSTKATTGPMGTKQTINVSAEKPTNPMVNVGSSTSSAFMYTSHLGTNNVLTPSTTFASLPADGIAPLKSSTKLNSAPTTAASITTSNVNSIKTISTLFPTMTIASMPANNVQHLKVSNTSGVSLANESTVQVGGVKPIKSNNKFVAPPITTPSILTPEIHYTSIVLTTTLTPIKIFEVSALNNGITERIPSIHITSTAPGFTEQLKTSSTKVFPTVAPKPLSETIELTENNKVKVLPTIGVSIEPSDKKTLITKPNLTNNKIDVPSGTEISALASDGTQLNASNVAEVPSTTTVSITASPKKPLNGEITSTTGPLLSMAYENPLANITKVEVPSSMQTSKPTSNALSFQTSNKIENASPTATSVVANYRAPLKPSNKVEFPSPTGPSTVPSNLSILKTNKLESESDKGTFLETQLKTLGIQLTTNSSNDISNSSVNTNVSSTNPSTHVTSTLPSLQANSSQSTISYTIVDTTEYKVTQRPDTKSTPTTPTHVSVAATVMNELESSLLDITTEYKVKNHKPANEGDLVKEGISAVANLLLQEKQPTAVLSPPQNNVFLNSPAMGEIKHATTSDFSSDVTETDNNEDTPSEKDNTTVQDGYGVSGEDMKTSTINYISVLNDTSSRPSVNIPHSTTDDISHEITPYSSSINIQNSTKDYSEQTIAVTEPAVIVNTADTKLQDNEGTTHKENPISTIRTTAVNNSSQILPPKESKLDPNGAKQKVVIETNNGSPLNINTSMSNEGHFEPTITHKNNSENESKNFTVMLNKPVNESLQSNDTSGLFNNVGGSEDKTLVNASTTSDTELIEQKAAPKPIGASSKKPGVTGYRPHQTDQALQPPTAVELHPAPYESMGLETSIAFLGEDVRRFSDLCNELGFRMWTSITGKGQIASRSLVLSPFAAVSMLAMVFLGARGPTSGQMNDLLKLDDMVTFNPHQVMQNITESVISSRNHGAATAAFVRELYSDKLKGKLLDFYKERVQQYYDGHVEEVSFNVIGDILRRRTNLLVKRQTLGKVSEYLRGSSLILRPPLAAFTANIYQTECDEASMEGRDGEMYFVVRPSTRQRRLVPVPAAVWRSGFLAGYEPGLDATAVCLGAEAVVSTVLVLPGQQGQVAPGDGLARLEQRLLETSYRRGVWSRLLRSLLPRPGLELQLPRFSHRSVLNVTSALHKMGLGDLLTRGRADLRGLNGLSTELHLSDVLQVNTFSTCGGEAPGARHHVETYPVSPQRMARDDVPFSNDLSGLPSLPLAQRPRQARLPDNPRLRFDRPFLYLVRHNPSGMVLYIGRFNPRLLP